MPHDGIHRRGRPPGERSARRTVLLTVRMTPAEYDALCIAARRARSDLSVFVRDIIARHPFVSYKNSHDDGRAV